VDTPVIRQLGARHDLDEIGFDRESTRLAKQWIATHPAQFLKLIPLKLAKLWAPDGEAQWAYEGGYPGYAAHAGLFRLVRIVNQAWYFMLLGLAALAAVLMLRKRRAAGQRWIDWWLLPYAIAAYPSVIAVMFFGMARFHFVAMPFLCMAAGWAAASLLTQITAKSHPA
ncbi:MAG: glycosyl transferase, partial [Sphingomonadales bacterium]|nr:glycosyl transferase [Sphingomonadales bacterium]